LVVCRKSSIARFVRQTRTITYEKRKNLRAVSCWKVSDSEDSLRQTRTRSVRCRSGSLATEYRRGAAEMSPNVSGRLRDETNPIEANGTKPKTAAVG
jgi:hypothetical protein